MNRAKFNGESGEVTEHRFSVIDFIRRSSKMTLPSHSNRLNARCWSQKQKPLNISNTIQRIKHLKPQMTF